MDAKTDDWVLSELVCRWLVRRVAVEQTDFLVKNETMAPNGSGYFAMTEPTVGAHSLGESKSNVDQRFDQIAGDLHDGLLQYVIAARMVNEALRRKLASSAANVPTEVNSIEKYLQQAISEGRRLLDQLHSATVERHDPADALGSLAAELIRDGQVHCQLTVDPSLRLGPSVATALYRVAQEAVSNIRRHSRATEASIHMQGQPDAVCLTIEDNGQGFDPQAIGEGHFGLVNMRRRVEALGGTLTVQSRDTGGSRLVARMPFPNGA